MVRRLALGALCLGQFMLQLDTTIVNVALPNIAQDLHARTSDLQWVVDGYILALASLLLSTGRIGDRSGHKRVYLTGLGIFGLGSGLCALATSTGELTAFRVIQGIGAAMELPATLALVRGTFPDPRRRGLAIGIWTGSGGLSLVLGPVIGGALIRAFDWRAVFLVNLPVALIAGVLAAVTVREYQSPSPGHLDLPGQVLGAAGLGLLAGAAIETGAEGFLHALPVGLFLGGAGALAAFVLVERLRPEPMLPLGYFRDRAYSAANFGGLVMGFVIFSFLFAFPLYFQQVEGETALASGLKFIPLCGAFALIGPVIGRLVHRTGHRVPMTAGLSLIALGAVLLLPVGARTGYGAIGPAFLLVGIGYGLVSTPMANAVLAAVPANRAGMAASTNNTARQIGGVFSVAVIGSLLPTGAGGEDYAGRFVTGLHTGLGLIAGVSVLGAVLALTQIPRRV
jgi:DHA2 family methylenomycin A resistance protein-like MFS transporter